MTALEELQAEAQKRGIRLREIPERDGHPYNPQLIGWTLRVTYPVQTEIFAPYLTTAYERLLGKFNG